jgi:hypothetical protein
VHSNSDDISPRESALQERRDRAVNAFAARIPGLYQMEIELAPAATSPRPESSAANPAG